MENKDRLLKQAIEGEALSGLKTHHGYKALIVIFEILYAEAWEKLRRKESEVARATLEALENIVSQIDDKIKLGKQSREEFNELCKIPDTD
jgi:hypothetical protein